jgi:hypothetical protein
MNSFKQVIKVSIHVRSSNDQINWSNWEDAGNGLSLKITPSGRYLQVEAVLEIIKGLNSPVVYDISVNALNTTSGATDLAVNITGNASSVGMGDTVHLVIGLSNLGPNPSNASLVYKIPVGLKLLSSQGPGVYDAVSGVWNAGLLLVNDSVSLDLVLQAVNIGYFVNLVSVYGDLTSTHASAVIPVVKVFNGLWRSTAAMGDSNSGNNVASYIVEVRSVNAPSIDSFDYNWPDDVPPVPNSPNEPQSPQDPQKPQDPPKPSKPSNDQLPRDINSVRDIVSGVEGAKIADWNLKLAQPAPDDWETLSNTFDVAMGLLYLSNLLRGPGANEYLQEVKNGMANAMSGIKMASEYFIKDPRKAYKILKKTFTNWGEGDAGKTFWKSDRNFVLDPAYAQKYLVDWLCKKFPGAEGKIRTLFGMLGAAEFLSDPLDIWKTFGDALVGMMEEGENLSEKTTFSLLESFTDMIAKYVPFQPSPFDYL